MKKKLNVMRWLLPVAAVSLLAWSCTREIPGQAGDDNGAGNDKGTGNDVIATFADAGTRTSLGEDGSVLWSAGDEISVWLKTADNREYKLDGEGGTTSGTFKYAAGPTDGAAVAYNYGVYPYSEENKLTEDGKLLVTVPVVQPYKEGGFAEGVNVAVAVSEDKNLSFKNLNGYVKVKLYAAEGIKVKDVVHTA